MINQTQLYIDLNILTENINKLKNKCLQNKILFMVKANAYGHGLVPIVRHAGQECGIDEFGVATLSEAMILRREIPGLKNLIYVFSNLGLLDNTTCYSQMSLIPVISTMRSLEIFLNTKELNNVPLTIKLNTGMNRLGIHPSELDAAIIKIKNTGRKNIYHLMTHLSSSCEEITESGSSILQKEKFDGSLKKIEANGIRVERTSISNSGAIEQSFGLEYSHIRPGLMIYGPSALLPEARSKSFWKGLSISSLETNILHVFSVDKGDGIGYNLTATQKKGTIIIIAIGYGDGLSTKLQGVKLNIKKHSLEVFGRVNMDMAQLFYEGETNNYFKVSDKIKIWGPDTKDILSISDQSNIIPYELYCMLTNRVSRVYNIN